MKAKIKTIRCQSGAVLVVSLILLLVMTILGVATMDSTNLELKMSNNNQNRQRAFQAAETALALVEAKIINEQNAAENLHFRSANALRGVCSSVNTKTDCYEDTCTGGLCFFGEFGEKDPQIRCAVGDSHGTLDLQTEKGLEKVLDSTTLGIPTVPITDFGNAKYLIEFLCYAPRNDELPFSAREGQRNNGIPLFKITAKAESGNSVVLLQSTFQYPEQG